jgi:DNA-binding NtrC family response regulator
MIFPLKPGQYMTFGRDEHPKQSKACDGWLAGTEILKRCRWVKGPPPVNDPSVSRLHACLAMTRSGAVHVVDCGSSNGTMIMMGGMRHLLHGGESREWTMEPLRFSSSVRRAILRLSMVESRRFGALVEVSKADGGLEVRAVTGASLYATETPEDFARRVAGSVNACIGCDMIDAVPPRKDGKSPGVLKAYRAPDGWRWVINPKSDETVKGSVYEALERIASTELLHRMWSREYPDAGPLPLLPISTMPMGKVLGRAKMCAQESEPVLLHGETGVGKRVVALYMHAAGFRTGRWHSVNVAELSSASESRTFLVGSGATVLLDEITAGLGPSTQDSFNTTIDRHRHRILFVATTRYDPATAKQGGLLAPDVARRFKHLRVPPLRERRDEIWPLIRHCLEWYNLGPDIFDEWKGFLVEEYPWEGNLAEVVSRVQALREAESPDRMAREMLGEMQGKGMVGAMDDRSALDLVIGTLGRYGGGAKPEVIRSVLKGQRFMRGDRFQLGRMGRRYPDRVDAMIDRLEAIVGNDVRIAAVLGVSPKTVQRYRSKRQKRSSHGR